MEYLHKRYEDGTLAQGNAIKKKKPVRKEENGNIKMKQ